MGAMIVFFDHFPFSPNSHIRINVLAFFFVLSGFLIVRLYYNKIEQPGKNMRTYFLNRFARIYPVYFLLLTVAVLLRHDFRLWLLIKNYTLTHAFVNNENDFIIPPSWSLTVEECFYFLAPFIIFFIKRFNFLTSFIFASVLLSLALLIARPDIPIFRNAAFVFSTTFFGHFAEFYAGVYLALIMIKKEQKGIIKIKGLRWTLTGAAGVAALIIAMGYVYAYPPPDTTKIIIINNFLIPVPIAILYYGLMCENSMASRILSAKWPGILGRSSYTFYLLHTIIIYSLAMPYLLPYFGSYYVVCSVLTCVVTWFISIAIFVFYEEPLNLFIRKKFITKENTKPSLPM